MSVKYFQPKSSPLRQVETVQIKVLQKYNPDPIEFDSIIEFQRYLSDHEAEMNAMTTQKLNQTFKITDEDRHYRITKLKGKISLRRLNTVMEHVDDCRIDELERKIEQLEQSLIELQERFEELIRQ
jgi:hypothetical protein